jgi:hypothetical protein
MNSECCAREISLEGNSRQDPKSHASRIAKSGREKASGRSADDVGCTTNELRERKQLAETAHHHCQANDPDGGEPKGAN